MTTPIVWRGLSTAQADGWACVVCGADYWQARPVSVPVGVSESGSQVFACAGQCADLATTGGVS